MHTSLKDNQKVRFVTINIKLNKKVQETMDKVDILIDLLLGDEGFLIKLRLGQGFDNSKFEKIKVVLKELALEWEKESAIPKKACDIFVDFSLAIEGTLNLYDESTRYIIMKAEDDIMDLIRACVCNY